MPQIASLFTSLSLESQSFHVSLKKAVDATQRDVGKIQQTLSGLKTGLQAVGGAILTAGFLSAGRTALDYAASLGEVSQQLGVTTRDLQLYRYIGTQVNLTEEEMDKGLQRLTRTIAEAAAGSKKQATAFRELGVAVQDANGRTKTAGEVIPRLATAIAQIESPTLRAKMAYDLFGKSGQQMLPLLEMGEKGIKEFAERAEDLGLVMDDALITKADKASDRLAELNKQLEVKWASTVSENADAILTLANALSDLAAAAVQVSAKLPGALSIAAGAAVGGRVAGGPGALVGGLGGLTYALYDRSANDPYGVKGLSDADLKKRAKSLAGQVRQISDRSFNADESQQMLANANAVRDEINRRRAAQVAGRSAGTTTVPDGALPTPAGSGKKSGGGRKAKPERDRTEEYRQEYLRELRGLFDDELALQQQLTTDTRERAMIEHERIDRAQVAFVFETERAVRSGELTQAQADELKLQYAKNAQLEHAQVNRDLDARLAREELDLSLAANDNRRDLLERDRASARTAKDRGRIELELLDLEYERARLALEDVIASKDASENQKKIARARLELLGTLKERDAAQTARDNAGPMARYLDEVAQSADELNESLERAAVDGLGDLKSGLKGVLLEGENVFDALGDVVDRFADKLLDLALDQAFSALLGGGQGGGGFNFFGLFGGGKKGGYADFTGYKFQGLPKMATGGSFRVDGLGGIDRNVLSIGGKPRAMVSASERLHVTPANDRGPRASTLEVVPSKWFDLIVDGKVVSTGGGMMRDRERQGALAMRQRVDF